MGKHILGKKDAGMKLFLLIPAFFLALLVFGFVAFADPYTDTMYDTDIEGTYGPGMGITNGYPYTGNYVGSTVTYAPGILGPTEVTYNNYTYPDPGTSASYGPGTYYPSSIVGSSGWVSTENGGYMYLYANGTYARNNFDQIDGSWYYFDANGLMHTGWLYINGYWYYMLPDGKMAVSSWNNINEKWYYFNFSGVMQTGYIILDGKVYYADATGARVQSAYNQDGHLFDANGVLVS